MHRTCMLNVALESVAERSSPCFSDQVSLSRICVWGSMTSRSMYAEQDEDEECSQPDQGLLPAARKLTSACGRQVRSNLRRT